MMKLILSLNPLHLQVINKFLCTCIEKEKKKTSVLTRVISGFSILFAFEFIVYLGHYPILILISAIQVE